MKKVISLFLALIFCVCLISGTTSAETVMGGIAQPTNTLKTNGNGGKTDVGTWYITYNNEKMWSNNFGSDCPIMYRMLMPDGSYGIPTSDDVEVIDYHIKVMAEAGIDFIVYDLTNGGLTPEIPYGWSDVPGTGNNTIVDTAKLTCERIDEWNKNNEWQIRYAVAVGGYSMIRDGLPAGDCIERQVKAVYEQFVENEVYGDDYYTVDGKYMLIVYDWIDNMREKWEDYVGDKTYGEKFFVRAAKIGEPGTYGWYCEYGTSIRDEDNEVMLVNPGQCNAGAETPHAARDNGRLYKTCWESVLNGVLPRIIMISGFNDYNEQTAVYITDSSKCDGKIEEIWYDENGEINNSMYWDMTLEGIKLVRIFNGEIEGRFTSDIFDLGDADESVNLILIIIIAVAAVVLIAGVVVLLIILKKKKAKKNEANETEENS